MGDIKIELFCERTPKTCEVSHTPGVGLPSGETAVAIVKPVEEVK